MIESGNNTFNATSGKATRIAFRVSVIYCIAGFLWILFSDGVLEIVLPTKRLLSEAQTYKGWFFILFTSLCLFIGLKRYLDNWAHETERRVSAENALLQSELQYRRIVETAEEGIWVIDAENKTVFVNQKMAAILGYRVNEMVGRPLFDFMDADGVVIATRNVERRKKGIRETHEFEFKRKDGVRVWTMLNASPMFDNGVYSGALAMVTDITERKRSEDELQRHRDLLATAEEQAQLGSWRLETLSGPMLCSLEMRRLLGCAPDDNVTLQTFLNRIHADDRPNIQRCFESEAKQYSAELRLLDSHGSVRHISFAYSTTRDADDRIVCFQGIAQDITERKRTDEQLRQNQKMTAVGELAGGVAHDFNNQLAAILGYAAMLRDQLSDERQQQLAEKICTAAERSADLTRKLLAFSHKGTNQRVPVDIKKILGETAEMLQRSIDKRIRIELNFHAPQSIVCGDPSQLQSAFLNLGLNARDAMPEGGVLRFETELCELPPELPHGTASMAGGGYLRVNVVDTGEGMTPEVQRRVFEPFFTTKPLGKGTGLGLPSVYGTVLSHGGTISIESAPRQGSTFSIVLPLHAGPAPTAACDGRPENAKDQMECILLAEDEAPLRELMLELLSDQCRELLVAKDGLQAIELFEKNFARIELVILDMQMPGASGTEVIANIRRVDPQARILVTSGYPDAELPDVSGFLQKPFRSPDLLTAIQHATRKTAIAE